MAAAPSLLRFVRPLPGPVGATQRVCHVGPVGDEGLEPPKVLVAYCGVRLGRYMIEFLPDAQGQPCFTCLMRVPLPKQMEGGS